MHNHGFTLIELLITIAIVAILAAISITQYQNYIIKTQFSRVMTETGNLRNDFESCVLNGLYNVSQSTCTTAATSSTLLNPTLGNANIDSSGQPILGTPEITFNQDGSGSIKATFGNQAAIALHALHLTWVRSGDGGWTCQTDVPGKYRAVGCL